MMILVVLAAMVEFASAANLRSNSFEGITTGTGLGEKRRSGRLLRRSHFHRNRRQKRRFYGTRFDMMGMH